MRNFYCKTIGRIQLLYRREFGDNRCVTLFVRAGWNDSCPMTENILSLEELRDLKHMLDQVLAISEKQKETA